MNILLATLLPVIVGTTSTNTMSGILSQATEVLTWFITSMTSLLSFITDNPVVLVMFMVFLVGAVVAMLMRIWKSV